SLTLDCAHEIGHNLGLEHASNDHGESKGGDWVPLNPHGEIGGLGWNPQLPAKLIPSEEDQPGQFHSHDFMSYGACSDFANAATYFDPTVPYYCSSWISPENYGRIAQRLLCSDPQSLDDDTNQSCLGGIAPFNVLIGENHPLYAWVPTDNFELAPVDIRAGPSIDGRYLISCILLPGDLDASPLLASLPAQSFAPGAATTPSQALLVSGSIFPDGHAQLGPFYQRTLATGVSNAVGSGAYRIELQSA